jgi:hypothetical protein
MIMTKFMQMLSRNLEIAAIVAIACIYTQPTFGQRVPGPTRAIDERVQGGKNAAREEQLSSEEQTIKVFNLKYSDAETMAHMLAQIIPGLNVAIDQRNNAIVVNGTKEMSDTAQVLLSRLDSTGANDQSRHTPVSIRLVWLVEGDESAAPPAENLKGVVEELRHQGLKNLGQVAQAVVRSQYGNVFHISCSPLLENKPTMLTADGTIMPGGELEIHVASARPGGPETVEAAPGPDMPVAAMPRRAMPGADMRPGVPMGQSSVEVAEKLTDLNVHTAFKTNEYIVLAVAPIGKITSVFVIQITESNP